MSKPSIPEGVRDFSPEIVAKRTYIFDTIKKVFVKYGFQPIETPTLEKLSTLTGKYGDEGDKLLFKVLNNGDFLSKADPSVLEAKNSSKLVAQICDRGLRYDLTVPFARYVVMHQNDIVFPFKRYQIQPVWRADRPQRGRYREFYQCDVDVVGSNSLMYEAELVQIYDEVFANLGLDVAIKINNRKILAGMADVAGCSDKFMDMTVAIDKLDKIGLEGVRKEMTERGIGEDSQVIICKLLEINNLAQLENFVADLKVEDSKSENLLRGVSELRKFHSYFDLKDAKNEVRFDITLARGLNYYTGCIFEVAAKNVKMGSIGGGGRYDDLTGSFGLKNVSGVGVSFGADRIYDCLAELDLFPKESAQNLKVLFYALDEESHLFAFNKVNEVRAAGINADIYPEPVKFRKIWEHAEKRNVPFVVFIGENERKTEKLTIKDMVKKEVKAASMSEIIEILSSAF
jgi:histidyl-tRNA synthetase